MQSKRNTIVIKRMSAILSLSRDVARVLKFWGSERRKLEITRVDVLGSSEDSVNGQYFPTAAEEIPYGFKKVKVRLAMTTIFIISILFLLSRFARIKVGHLRKCGKS